MIEGFSFLYIRFETIYVVAATASNGNAIMIFEFLYEIVDILRVLHMFHFTFYKISQQIIYALSHISMENLMKQHSEQILH